MSAELIIIANNGAIPQSINLIAKKLVVEEKVRLGNYSLEGGLTRQHIVTARGNIENNIQSLVHYSLDETTSYVAVIDSTLKVSDEVKEVIAILLGKPVIYYEYDATKKEFVNSPKKVFSGDSYEELFNMYAEGTEESLLNDYLSEYDMTFKDLIMYIVEENIDQESKRLSNTLKVAIANRDRNGISRKIIARELGINYKTVQRACEKYGNPSKNMDKTSERDLYEDVSDTYTLEKGILICPRCNKKTNLVDSATNSHYCKHCLQEYVISDTGIKRVKWENIN